MRHVILMLMVVVPSMGFDVREPHVVVNTLVGGEQFEAGVVHVRDSAVVFTRGIGAADNEVMARTDAVVVVPFENIVSVRSKGSPRTLLGAAIGVNRRWCGGHGNRRIEPRHPRGEQHLRVLFRAGQGKRYSDLGVAWVWVRMFPGGH